MGSGKGSTPGPSPQVSQGLLNIDQQLATESLGQYNNSQQLYNLTEPGLNIAENWYQTLASGDPGAIMRATAPTAQAAASGAAGAKANIMANSPAGGEKNLALEQTDVNRGALIASTASGANLGSYNALGQLSSQGIGESISEAGTAISGQSAAGSTLSNLGNLQLEGQQIAAEQKGQQLGALGGLAGDATLLGTPYATAGAASKGGKGAGDAAAAGGAGKGGSEAASIGTDVAKGAALA